MLGCRFKSCHFLYKMINLRNEKNYLRVKTMAKSFKQYKNPWLLVFLILLGGLVGDAVASVLPPRLSVLKAIGSLGMKPATLDMHFLKLTFGLTFDLGLLTVMGLIFGYLLYRNM